MDLRQLTYFLSVIEHGSVGKAAEHLHMTQPALSKSIRRLEEGLAVKLFERGPEGMTPTTFGVALAAKARFISLEVRNVVEELDDLRGVHRGSVVVGSSPSAAGELLAQATRRAITRRPDLRITVIEGIHEALLPCLLGGQMDFIVGTTTPDQGGEDIRSDLLFQDEVAVIARVQHPLARARRIDLADLIDCNWVLAGESDALRRHLMQLFVQAGLPASQPQAISGSAQFIKSLVLDSDFLAYLPRILTQAEESAKLLVALPVAAARWKRDVHILRRARGSLAPGAQALLKELRQVCGSRRELKVPA
jgi:DNA-binding transcriptional LysR family regulator